MNTAESETTFKKNDKGYTQLDRAAWISTKRYNESWGEISMN